MLNESQIIASLKDSYENSANIQRKRRSQKELDVYLGVIEPYVREELKRFYTMTEDFIVLSFANLAKKAVTNLARLYSSPAKRVFNNVSDAQAAVLESLYQEMKIDQVLMKANQLFKLSSQAHLQVAPTVTQDGSRSILARVIGGQLLDVVESPVNKDVAEAYGISGQDVRQIYIDPNGDDLILDVSVTGGLMSVWSSEFNFVIDTKTWKILSSDTANNLGINPIIEISGEKYGSYWATAKESFSDFTVQFNTSLSDAGQAKRFQGMPIGWIKGTEEQLKEKFQFGPNSLIKLPKAHDGTSAEVGFTNPNVDLDKLMNFDSALLSLFLTCADIDPSAVNAKGGYQKYTSGFDRFLAMIDSFKPSKEDASLFKDIENRLVKVIARYVSVYGGTEGFGIPNVGEISEDVSVSVTFVEPQEIVSNADLLSQIERELSLGLITRVEAVAKYRGTTIEEAQAFIDAQNQGT